MWQKRLSRTAVAFLLAVVPGVLAQDGNQGADTIKEFLKKTHANKKWQTGPNPIGSDEIKKAYGGEQKFYYVFSAPPLPPGANLPDLVKAYRARYKDYLDNYVSATVRVDAAGKVIPLTKVGDYNEGLMAVKNEEDVRVAAAAVLSLYGSDKVALGLVKTSEVKVTRSDQGWQGVVQRANQFQGTVEFNTKGQVTKLSKIFTGPVPP